MFLHVHNVHDGFKIFHSAKSIMFNKAPFQCGSCQGVSSHADCLVSDTTVLCCGCLAARKGISPLTKLVLLSLVLNQSPC